MTASLSSRNCLVCSCRLWCDWPVLFEEGGATVTVTSDQFAEMLETFLHPKLDNVDTEDVWFQQRTGPQLTQHNVRSEC